MRIRIAAVHDLRSGISPPNGVFDSFPRTGFLWRHEAIFTRGICPIRNSKKGINSIELVASDFPERGICYGNVIPDLEVLFL
jgi:hypothetical protein